MMTRHTIFKRVPFRAQFNITGVRVNTTQSGTFLADSLINTKPTGYVKFWTDPLVTRSPTLAVLLPSPGVVVADHPFDAW